MKVRELIALLVECNPDSNILIRSDSKKYFEPTEVHENKALKLVYVKGDGK